MEIKLNVRGIEATIVVSSVEEARSLLMSLSEASGTEKCSSVKVDAVTEKPADDTEAVAISVGIGTPAQVRLALLGLRGSVAASLLKELHEASDHALADIVLKDNLANRLNEEKVNLGPIFSNISKQCKVLGISVDSIYSKHTKRGRKGKVLARYKLTDTAVDTIAVIEDFENGDPIFEEQYPKGWIEDAE